MDILILKSDIILFSDGETKFADIPHLQVMLKKYGKYMQLEGEFFLMQSYFVRS